jgi:hypothetical protein
MPSTAGRPWNLSVGKEDNKEDYEEDDEEDDKEDDVKIKDCI